MDYLKTHILAPTLINVRVVSSHPKGKAVREKELNGSYKFIETVNNRPVYKVKPSLNKQLL